MSDWLDDAVDEFYRSVFEHAYELGQEWPDDNDPKMVFDPCNAEDAIRLKELIRSKLE